MNQPELQETLIQAARQVQANAYAPYSNYPVGAALLTKTGEIFTGVNVENAVYSLTICAERSAIFKAVAAGITEYDAIAVVTRDGGTPCGSCRQVMAEFGLEMTVLICDDTGKVHQETTVGELLPLSFGPNNLKASK